MYKFSGCLLAVWREMVAMQRRGTNVVIGGDRQKLGARQLDPRAVINRNKKQITAVLVSLTVFAILLSKVNHLCLVRIIMVTSKVLLV